MSAHWVTPRTMNIGVSQRAWERAGIGCSECVNASGPANVKKKGPAFPPLETVKSRAFHPSITLEERHSLRPGGFYPANADTSEKAHCGPGGVSWQSERDTARSSSVRR